MTPLPSPAIVDHVAVSHLPARPYPSYLRELFYVRDDRDGGAWSLTPEPAGAGAEYLVSHGQGFTEFA